MCLFLSVLYKTVSRYITKKRKIKSSLFKDVVLFFIYVFIFRLFSSSPTPNPLRWRSTNPPRFFCHARSRNFEEKILGLQPRDKAAMLGVKTKEYFLEEFT